MGRLLEIARRTEHLVGMPEVPPTLGPSAEAARRLLPPVPLPAQSEIPFDQGAADVLDILVKAKRPVLHSGIVKALAARGYDKTAAYQAIARCQRRGLD